MSKEDIFNELKKIVSEDKIFKDEPMSNHTTFHTGGPADFYVVPSSGEEIKKLVSFSKDNEIEYTLFGNGSNTLVTDKGIRGIIISLKGLDKIDYNDNTCEIKIGAGYSTIKASNFARDNELTGFEFACGIPGTIGGGIYMNAGAYGGEFKDIVEEVECYLPNENVIKVFSNAECKFEYRSSIFHSLEKAIILSCKIKLEKGNKEDISEKMKENIISRAAKQPINLPCAGSIFRREEGVIVAKLIDDAGLKGHKVGGAEVSTLHAGFIVNSDNATSQDILDLIDYIKKVIFEKYNVTLHEEVKIVGER